MMWGFSPVLSVFWRRWCRCHQFPARDTSLFSYDLFSGKGRIADLIFRSPFVKAMEAARSACSTSPPLCRRRHYRRRGDAHRLGLKFSSIVIDYAGGSLLLTAIYTSLVVWIVGLAVR